jgi:hypothetical protein
MPDTTLSTPAADLGGMTGAELFVYESDASEHGTPAEIIAVRDEIARRASHANVDPAAN